MVNYSTKKFDKEHMAKVMGRNLSMSLKQTVEVCNFIRGKSINDVKVILKRVSEKKIAVPFKRFNKDLGHKKMGGAGRFPVKVSRELIKLLEAVEANAQFKGLNTANLTIKHICAHKGSKVWHFGRKRRRKMKRTNVEIVVEEKVKKGEGTKEQVPKKETKKEDVKELKKKESGTDGKAGKENKKEIKEEVKGNDEKR